MEQQLDLNGMQFYIYAAIGAGVLVVLAVIVSLLPIGKLKLPAVVLSSISCLVVGFALGLLALSLFGYRWDKTTAGIPREGLDIYAMKPSGGGGAPGGGAPPKAPGGGGGAPAGGPGGGGPGGGGPGGGRGPSAKAQLGNLVTKLEILTRAPLKIELTDEQRAKINEQLEGLAEPVELPEDEAKKRLDALLVIVQGDHETLEAAGFRVPGRVAPPGPVGGVGGAPSPFMEAEKLKSLKDLKERVSKGKPAG